ncbi:hypothetical protein NADFUDRAFT_50964 [Nadsonia fulvescens var. elongata DSM 6958]|uniref:Dystroglycan-type cadherin-like domain-containing protein n=1 Tax=Nadsonia fulvescens var. elongata DSM 6958 TaxID=857566 RepID=A0A1E3PK50_9ASCO|nr:hypothetical protein NADFUDRAFT_50964 [Nadsonia fulvescens var. elongata DSM 6958]
MITILHCLITITSLLRCISAAPVESFPFNNQIPPVARYDQDYYYQIRSDTFTSSVSSITYSTSSLPDWLNFDQTSLILSGKPTTNNNSLKDQTISFQLTGTDSEASVSSDCSIILSAASPPTVNSASSDTVASQLLSQGKTDGSTGFVITPGNDFSISLSDDTFLAGDREIIAHYGLMANHTPLPIWMSYDESNLSFKGKAPSVNSQVAPAQRYQILFVAADYSGYSGASVEFSLVVGAHQLVSNIHNTTLTVKNNESINYTIPIDQILIDGSELTMSNVTSFSSNITDATSWLSFDTAKGTLSGTVPKDATKETMGVSLQVLDVNGNQINYVLTVSIEGSTQKSLFTTSTFANINITRNEFFNYTIPSSYIASTDSDSVTYNTSISPSSAESQISFYSSNMTFVGRAPNSLTDLTVNLTAINSSNQDFSESRSFIMKVIDKRIILSSTSSNMFSSQTSMSVSATNTISTFSSTFSSTASATSAPAAIETPKKSSNKTLAIALGVALPCVAILVAALLFFCCRRRNRKNTNTDANTAAGASGSSTVPTPESGPINGPPIVGGPTSRGASNNATTATGQDPEKISDMPNGPFMAAGVLTTPPMADQLHTPPIPNSADTAEEWDTPKRMSNLNFFRIDGEEEKDISCSDSEYEGDANAKDFSYSTDETKADDNSDVNIDGILADIESDIAAMGGANPNLTDDDLIAAAINDNFEGPPGYGNPHQSWRQTIETNRRWQTRDSLASLATVSTNELFSVRVADEENANDNYRDYRMNDFSDDNAQNNIPRDNSSGIIRPISEAMSLSSVYSTMDTRDGNTDHNNYRVSKRISMSFSNPTNLAAVSEESSESSIHRKTSNDENRSVNLASTVESSDASFETASAGSDNQHYLDRSYQNDTDLGDLILRSGQGPATPVDERSSIIRPFRDQTGKISFRNTAPVAGLIGQVDEVSDTDTEADAFHDTVSGITYPRSPQDRDDISVDENANTNETARLVNFTNRRSINPTTNTSVENFDKSFSGELAFL